MEPDILPADPTARRKALVVVLSSAVISGVALSYSLHYLQTLTTHDSPESVIQLQHLFILVMGAIVLLCLWSAVYLFRCGRNILREKRYPLHGTKVVRATPIRSGTHAERIGRGFLLGAIFLVLLSVGLLIVTKMFFTLIAVPPPA